MMRSVDGRQDVLQGRQGNADVDVPGQEGSKMTCIIPDHLRYYDWYAPHLKHLGYDVHAAPEPAKLIAANLSGAKITSGWIITKETT